MVRFSDEWLESDEFKAHADALHADCSEAGRPIVNEYLAGIYRKLDPCKRERMFELERRRIAERKANPPKPADPGEVRKNMEELLYRWENGLHDFGIDYPGGPAGLRMDLEDGRFG